MISIYDKANFASYNIVHKLIIALSVKHETNIINYSRFRPCFPARVNLRLPAKFTDI